MSNNKKIVSILFSVVVLLSGVQVSALTFSQFNPIRWNIGSKLSALKIGFPQFLKGWKAEGKSVEIEMQEFSLPQETFEETTRQSFFSRLFSRLCFRMSSVFSRKVNKEYPYIPSIFPEVKILKARQIEHRECATQTDNKTQDSAVQTVQLNNDAETQTDHVECRNFEMQTDLDKDDVESSTFPLDIAQRTQYCFSLGMSNGKKSPKKRNIERHIIPFHGFDNN